MKQDSEDEASGQSSTTTDTDAESDPMAAAEARRDAFVATLGEYDDALVATVREAVAETSLLEATTVDLSVGEWLDVLETTAGDLYVSASSDRRDSDVRWFLRHDGAAFIYGTKRYGEMYRGDPAAVRQVESVIENHAVSPGPMAEYPIEQAESFTKDSTTDADKGGESA